MPSAANRPAPLKRAGNARGVHRGSGNADRADQLIVRHDGGDQRAAHAEVRRPHQAHERHDDEDIERSQMAGQRQRHQDGGLHRIKRAHHGEQVAVADAVADHAEHRGDQRADEIERGEHRQQQHRAGLDQHIPAENQRLHLERPGGEQIGGPLETVISDTEGCQRGRPRELAQIPVPRFIAFHPALFLVSPEKPIFPRRKSLPGSWTQRSVAVACVNRASHARRTFTHPPFGRRLDRRQAAPQASSPDRRSRSTSAPPSWINATARPPVLARAQPSRRRLDPNRGLFRLGKGGVKGPSRRNPWIPPRKPRFPAKSTDAGAPGGSTEWNSDQDAADLADLELSAFNRFSNHGRHSDL